MEQKVTRLPVGRVARPQKRKRRGGIDAIFLVLVLVLLCIGLVMMFSASYASAYYYEGNSFFYITKQLQFALIGLAGMFFLSVLDYHIFHRLVVPIFIGTTGLLILPRLMAPIAGVYRWIYIPGVGTFQPTEIAKFALVICFAHIVSLNYKRIKEVRYGLMPFLLVIGTFLAITLGLQRHVSASIILFTMAACLMIIGGSNKKWLLAGVAMAIALGAVLVFFTDFLQHVQPRIQGWIDPFSDVQGSTYQTAQSLIAIGSGGLMGLGPGNSKQKYLYIPEPQNDFVFAVVCEELGWVGATLIILLFALLVWRGFVIAMRAGDKFGSMIAVGITLQLAIQTLLNIAVVTNTFPNTGISLPFFSYGGTALCMLLGEMGVVLSVSREAVLQKAQN